MKRMMAGILAMSISTALMAATPKPPSFDGKRISQDVKVLASDAFEGRGPATAGETKTVAYIIEQMKAAGLEPGGDMQGGTRAWTQPVPLLRANISGAPQVSVQVGGATLADWGLHLVDMSVAMGDLVTLSGKQAAAWAARR